ncbi:zinc transport system substrate-binding protein [Hydrogenivirga caldilitoris]|uniref:Zinc transport system substrate-binding protein n=1 Tax=Hydrogenivirga caldilitoris TaxID=246264 RepID=A0A497XP83_9AQUI|nr:metal ABC transporter substrate-binding protein [Hydrogenivirga caldilitoris]RLJ70767.1 zinc transport system substrate-binding protein [Hydrogenivirga caldilitoris]
MRFLLVLILIPLITTAKEFVLVSVYPFYDVLKELSGDRFRVEVLIPPKADYHLYELSSKEIKKISQARLVFVSGIPLGGWERKVEEISGNRAFKLAEGIELKSSGEHGGVKTDPHIWLSPKRMMLVAENAYKAFVKLEPDKEDIYRENLRKVLDKLKELDRDYRENLKSCKHRVIPIPHPALGYLAQDYGLSQLSIGSGDVHGDISPIELSRFISEVKEKGINFMFEIYGARSKYADVFTKEYNLRIYRLNVKIIPSEHGKDYFSIMRYNLKVLREALECM